MTYRAICLALLPAVVPAAGCGTVSNLARPGPEGGGKAPFGGVRHDLACIQKASSGDLGFRGQPRSESEQYPQTALVLFCAVDLPFSLIGDVVTWPYAVAYSCINEPVPVPPVALAPPEVRPPAGP